MKFWVCPDHQFVRWSTTDGTQFLAYLDDRRDNPDRESCPDWLVDEALAAMSDSGTRHEAFDGFDRDWNAACEAMNEAWAAKEAA